MDDATPIDDLLDELVAEYSDAVAEGEYPDRATYLARVEAGARPGLERCLKMIDSGLGAAPAGLPPLVPGAELGRYRLKRELGRGGMAIVWLAEDAELRRPVALKILRPGLALDDRHTDRFRREAHAVARLQHPNVVQIHDVGELRGYQYLAMEFIEGPSLATVLAAVERNRFTADELRKAAGSPGLAPGAHTFEAAVAMLLAQVADALSAAHARGLVHRDVKPSNILLRSDGTAVVADFGLALSEGDPALSLTGDTLGTPYYMSPEQASLTGTKVDHRTDVYSLGVTLYEALSGQRPFEGDSPLEVFEAIKNQLPRSIRAHERRASKQAAAVVRMAMAHDANERYGSAEALASDLLALSESRAVHAWQKHGGLWRRIGAELRWLGSGRPHEYRSRLTFLGLPLIHTYSGRRAPGAPPRVAKGWIAAGEIAYGGLCAGNVAVGGIAFGGVSAGLLTSFGGIALAGVFSGGALSGAGIASCGAVSVSPTLAVGGVAYGHAAIGGFARGTYAMGENADGDFVIRDERKDLTEEEWWDGATRPLRDALQLFGVGD